jgi:hypothetical protein
MSPLVLDYAERLALGCVLAVALLAGMAGLLALPFGVVLLAFRKEWHSSGATSELLTLAPFLLAIGGGALSFAAYVERRRRRPALTEFAVLTRPRSTTVLVTLFVLPGPSLVVIPFLYRWLTSTAAHLDLNAGELSMLLAPVWMAVLLPSASLVALAATLAIAGPAGLLVYLGGSRRTGRIMLLFWLLQLLLLVSSVPIVLYGKTPDAQGEAVGFISYLLCVVCLSYAVPVFMLMRGPPSEQLSATEQLPSERVVERFHPQSTAPFIPELAIPQNSFLVRKSGGWVRFVRIAPPDFVISAPAYNTGAPALFQARAEEVLPLRSYLIESKDRQLCRIRRRMALLQTTGYVIEDPQSGQMLFELSRLSADGVDWAVNDWRQEPLGSFSLRQSSISGIDFDLLIGGIPCVRYFWRMNVLLPEVSGEWQEPVPQGFHTLLAIAVGVVLAHFLPEGLSRTRDRWRDWRGFASGGSWRSGS